MDISLAREIAYTGYIQPGVKDGGFIGFTDSNDDAHLKRGKFSGGKLTALMAKWKWWEGIRFIFRGFNLIRKFQKVMITVLHGESNITVTY